MPTKCSNATLLLGINSHSQKAAYERQKQQAFSSWAGKRAPFNSWAGKRSGGTEILHELERRKRDADPMQVRSCIYTHRCTGSQAVPGDNKTLCKANQRMYNLYIADWAGGERGGCEQSEINKRWEMRMHLACMSNTIDIYYYKLWKEYTMYSFCVR